MIENTVLAIIIILLLAICKYLIKFQTRWNKICKILGLSRKTDPEEVYKIITNQMPVTPEDQS